MPQTKVKGEDVHNKSIKAIDIDFSTATEKTTLVDNDSIVINDSADNLTKRSKLSTLLAYFTTIFQRKLLLQELSSLTDVIPTGFKGLFARASGLVWKNSDGTEKQVATTEYVRSRAENLITNGSGLLKNNYNFTSFIFDQVETHGGYGSFKVTGNVYIQNDEYIAVDNSKSYREIFWAKCGDADGSNYNPAAIHSIGVACLDADLLAITPQLCSKFPGSADTVLSADLNIGDAVMIVDNSTGWCNSTNFIRRNVTWWPYTNSLGYSYPPYSYSRNTSSYVNSNLTLGLWLAGGILGNTITLRQPWPGPALPSGTPIRNNDDGGGFNYITLSSQQIANTWTKYEGYIDAVSADGLQYTNKFRAGTQFVRLLFIVNSGVPSGNNVRFSDIWFGEFAARNLEIASATKYGVVTTESQIFAGEKTFTGKVISNETINFDANIEPTQTGASVTKTSTWMWQYLTQGVKWIRANMLALGELSTNAYRGDRGKIAYDHSQVAHAPSTAVALATVKADADIADAITKKHAHSNLTVLNAITEAFTIALKSAYDALVSFPGFGTTNTTASRGDHNHSLNNLTEKSYNSLTDKPASLPANGGNADTLDSLHASAFARFNTAFTTWDNIASNTPPVHVHVLDATGVLTYQDLFMVLDTNLSDTAPKVFVLQPGTYSISDIIDCSTANLVGIIGLSKHDTIIEIACNEALTNLKFLENVTLKITAAFAGTFLVSAADSAGSYVKSVSVACDDIVNDCFDVFAFQGFNSVENVDIRDVSGACNECKNISGVIVVNSTVTTATDVLTLFYSCVNLSNINITHNDFNKMFSKCDNVSNVVVNLASNENSQAIYSCTNVSNCNITGAFVAVASCTVVTNVIISTATTGILESAIITNCKTDSCTEYGFADSEKLSNCLASNTVLTGYDRCRGMVNNKADSNTTNYNSCNADLGVLYAVADTPNGGFNT